MSAVEPLTAGAGSEVSVSVAEAGGRLGALLELTKPGITRMVLITTAAGFYLASAGALDWVLFVNTLIGTGLVASAAGALNQWVERDADARMHRTSGRPLPSGRVDRSGAFAFSLLIGALGLSWLMLAVDQITTALVATSLLTYVAVYTPMKQKTWWSTIVGAVPGALPVLAGWTAGGGALDLTGLSLFGILFLWQMPHFYALAWIYREDYVRGGFRMLSANDPSGVRTARQAVLFALLLLPVSVLPSALGLAGNAYLAGALLLGLAYAGLGVALLLERTNRRAWRLFVASVVYLPVLLLLMVIDKLAV